ncbi:hypothetical protein D9758_019003 [Tetrapyrgos nigripes]|uniref:Uncharacterized protein n=1 Tax=Tetrapyrgos nigripes TaxID=182062 RepID=A0A8H5BBK5_9AGAR|nr:hypothetical protein D9758_019003 [Tetrapyrgos nigripes]
MYIPCLGRLLRKEKEYCDHPIHCGCIRPFDINVSSNNTNNNSESIFNVPILNTTNYEFWNYAITCLLEAKGLSRVASGTQKCYVNTSPTKTGNAPSFPEGFVQVPDEVFNALTESKQSSYNQIIDTFTNQWNQYQILVKKHDRELVETYKLQSSWDDKDEQALGYISSFLPNDVGLEMREFTREEIDDNHCAKAKGDYTLHMLWEKIDKKYSSPGPTSWFLDFKEFMSCMLDEKKDPANQIASLGAVLTRLKAYRFTVNDKFRALFLMDRIPQSWGNYAQFTLATIEPKNLTMAHVEGLILVEYKRRTGDASQGGDKKKKTRRSKKKGSKKGAAHLANPEVEADSDSDDDAPLMVTAFMANPFINAELDPIKINCFIDENNNSSLKERVKQNLAKQVRPQMISGYFILTHYERLMINELTQETVDFESFLRVEARHQMTCKLAEIWDYTYNSDGTHTEPYLRAKEDLNGDKDMTNQWFDHEGTICPIQKQIKEEVEYFCHYIMNKALSDMRNHKWIPQQFKKLFYQPTCTHRLLSRGCILQEGYYEISQDDKSEFQKEVDQSLLMTLLPMHRKDNLHCLKSKIIIPESVNLSSTLTDYDIVLERQWKGPPPDEGNGDHQNIDDGNGSDENSKDHDPGSHQPSDPNDSETESIQSREPTQPPAQVPADPVPVQGPQPVNPRNVDLTTGRFINREPNPNQTRSSDRQSRPNWRITDLNMQHSRDIPRGGWTRVTPRVTRSQSCATGSQTVTDPTPSTSQVREESDNEDQSETEAGSSGEIAEFLEEDVLEQHVQQGGVWLQNYLLSQAFVNNKQGSSSATPLLL